MSFSKTFIDRPIATALLMAAIMLTGILAFGRLPVASIPKVDFPTIQVSATLPGADPETMASSVATPLERQFAQISALGQMTSTTLVPAFFSIRRQRAFSLQRRTRKLTSTFQLAGPILCLTGVNERSV